MGLNRVTRATITRGVALGETGSATAGWMDPQRVFARREGHTRADSPTAGDRAGPIADPADTATFSDEALARTRGAPDEAEPAGAVEANDPAGQKLSEDEQAQVEKLRARDAEVRAHEAAHLAAGGSHVRGGATYAYQQGPDGKMYAIGGEVSIDVSPVPGNPQATIQKMQQVRAAALAPADPSGADRAVASRAAQYEAQAREELAAKNLEAAEHYAGAATGGAKIGQALDTSA